MKLTAGFAFLLFFSGFALSQEDYGPPEAIVRGLQSADRKAQLAVARWLTLEHVSPQFDFRECDIHLDDVKLDDKGDTAVMQVTCGYDLNIVALRRHGPLTEHLDTRYFYAAYDGSRAEYPSLIQPSLHEIVVHNAATVSGNLYEAYFVVLRLVDGRLHVAFNGLETAAEPRIGTARRSQKSTFTMIPASSKQSGEISQAGTVENGKQAYVIRRSFGWSEDLQAFVENEVPSVQRNR